MDEMKRANERHHEKCERKVRNMQNMSVMLMLSVSGYPLSMDSG